MPAGLQTCEGSKPTEAEALAIYILLATKTSLEDQPRLSRDREMSTKSQVIDCRIMRAQFDTQGALTHLSCCRAHPCEEHKR